jgi:TolA-binding protein
MNNLSDDRRESRRLYWVTATSITVGIITLLATLIGRAAHRQHPPQDVSSASEPDSFARVSPGTPSLRDAPNQGTAISQIHRLESEIRKLRSKVASNEHMTTNTATEAPPTHTYEQFRNSFNTQIQEHAREAIDPQLKSPGMCLT